MDFEDNSSYLETEIASTQDELREYKQITNQQIQQILLETNSIVIELKPKYKFHEVNRQRVQSLKLKTLNKMDDDSYFINMDLEDLQDVDLKKKLSPVLRRIKKMMKNKKERSTAYRMAREIMKTFVGLERKSNKRINVLEGSLQVSREELALNNEMVEKLQDYDWLREQVEERLANEGFFENFLGYMMDTFYGQTDWVIIMNDYNLEIDGEAVFDELNSDMEALLQILDFDTLTELPNGYFVLWSMY